MENNRKIETDLFNILNLINASGDYGFGHPIFIISMFDLIKPVTEEDITAFASIYLTPGYTAKGYGQEDFEEAINTLTELNKKYGTINNESI